MVVNETDCYNRDDSYIMIPCLNGCVDNNIYVIFNREVIEHAITGVEIIAPKVYHLSYSLCLRDMQVYKMLNDFNADDLWVTAFVDEDGNVAIKMIMDRYEDEDVRFGEYLVDSIYALRSSVSKFVQCASEKVDFML